MTENNNSSRINDNNYFVVNGWMINRLRLKGVALNAYAIIYGFSQDGENEFTGSLQYLCDFCGGVSKPTIIKALKELTEKGFIIRREETINNIMFTRYRINQDVVNRIFAGSKEILPPVKKLNGGSKETLPNGGKNSLSGSKETLPNKESINNHSEINKREKENIKEKAKAIIAYLNEKAGTKFRSTSHSTQALIRARLEEGFDVIDFETVIDKKCAEWIGTDFAQYLRPSTLFGIKFESYLNAPVSLSKKSGSSGFQITGRQTNEYTNIFADVLDLDVAE